MPLPPEIFEDAHNPVMTPGAVAAMLGISRERVRQMGRDGLLTPLANTGRSRLYSRSEVQRMANLRQAAAGTRIGERTVVPNDDGEAILRRRLESRRDVVAKSRERAARMVAVCDAEMAGIAEALALLEQAASAGKG